MNIRRKVRGSTSRNVKKDMFANFFTAEHFTLKLTGLILSILVITVALNVGMKYVHLAIAKHTFLQSFYSKVEVARERAKPLKLNNYLGQNESSLAPGFWEQLRTRGTYLGDCMRANYTSGDRSGKRFICEKRFNTYYGLSKTEPQTLLAATNARLEPNVARR